MRVLLHFFASTSRIRILRFDRLLRWSYPGAPAANPSAWRLYAIGCKVLILAHLTVVAAQALPCPSCVPLDDPTGPLHHGYALGLYPGGTNAPPVTHAALALSLADEVVPRDATGAPSASGLIGFISIGMSNTNQEFSQFERLDDARVSRNPRVVTVNCAVGGKSADVIVNPFDSYWSIVASRIAAAGLDPDQIQVVWLKEANGAVPDTSFPNHALSLQSNLRGIVQHLKDTFPNLKLCYLSSRIYGGYNSNPERSEPVSYEGGFSVRWLIEDQIAGDPGLNADPGAGPIEAPVLLWGPYLWANGMTPRASDGLQWFSTDYEGDFIHPELPGEWKVATLLHAFLAGEPTAAPWRDAPPSEIGVFRDALGDAYVDDTRQNMNFGSEEVLLWRNPSLRSFVRFDLSAVAGTVFHAKLSLKTPAETEMQRCDVWGLSNTTWNEATITAANAPQIDGPLLGTVPMASRGSAISIDVTNAVLAALGSGPNPQASFAFRVTGGNTAQTVESREAPNAPRLVLSTSLGPSSVEGVVPQETIRIDLARNPAVDRVSGRLWLAHDVVRADLSVFDAGGREVRALSVRPISPRELAFAWDGRDDQARVVTRGTYFLRARAHGANGDELSHTVAKVILVKS